MNRPATKIPPQLVGHGLGGRIPPCRRFLKTFQADRLQISWNATIESARAGRLVLNNLLEQHADASAKRRVSRKQFEEDDAKRVHVRTAIRIVAGARGLLRRHVGRSADDLALDRHCDLARVSFGQSEIHHVRLPVRRDNHVRRLEISVNHALFVRVVQRFGDFDAESRRFVVRRLALKQPLVQGEPLDEVTDNVQRLGFDSHFVDADDVRVPQRSRRSRFTQEFLPVLRIQAASSREFDGSLAIQFGVPGTPYRAECALPERFNQLETAGLFVAKSDVLPHMCRREPD